jgi:hypothetical protein
MNIEMGDIQPEDKDEDLDEPLEEDLVDAIEFPEPVSTDNVGDASVEINVEQLIADFEQSDDSASSRKLEVRRRLEDLAEEGAMEDTYAIEFDES